MSKSSVLSNVLKEINLYGSLLIIIGGIVGNISILILFRPRWKNSCALCLLCAAIFNGLNIIVNVWSRFVGTISIDPTYINLHLCQLQYYSGHVWSQIGRYMVCLACLDRYFLVKNNLHFQIISRPVVIRSIIGFIAIFWHITSIHIVILTKIENGFCGQFGIYKLIYFIYVLILASIIPPVLMAIFSLSAYFHMKTFHLRIQPSGGNNNSIVMQRKDRELLKMVLVESIVYILTSILYPVISLEVSITNYMAIQKSLLHQQYENFFFNLGIISIYFNNLIPFYTYLFASKTFRKGTKELLIKLWHRLIK